MKTLLLTFIITLTLGLTFSPNSYAAEATQTKPVIVQVKGMVCDFCAHAIMKVFKKEVGLPEENVSISLETQEVTLNVPENITITDEQIETFIQYSGYDFVAIKREE